jgi:hypothetical protein
MAVLYPLKWRLGTIAMPQKKNGHDSNASGEKVSSQLGTIAMPLIRMGTIAMPLIRMGTVAMPLIRMGTIAMPLIRMAR